MIILLLDLVASSYLSSRARKKYFSEWKNFLIDRIKSNKIEVVYTIKPLEGEENIFRDLIDRECYNEKYLNKILMAQEIYKCEDFNL